MNTKNLLTNIGKQYLCFGIFLFINTLFCIKYFSRYTDIYIPATIFIDAFLIFIFAVNTNRFDKKILSVFNYILLLGYLILGVFILKFVDIETLNVDRWSVITSFWQNFEKGEYVFFAQSFGGNYPGPMPFYYIMAYPFYLMGELGYFSLLGVPLLFLLLKYCNIETKIQTKILLILLFSPFLWWEIACRSNLLLNGTLILFSIAYFFKDFPKISNKKLIISAILFGLFLSTRNVFAIAYITACIFALKTNYVSFKQMIIMAILAIITFVGTFIPFVYNHWNDFLIMNPFVIQSSFLMPFGYTLIFMALAVIFGFILKKITDVYFYISINLFLCIFTYAIYQICQVGLNDAFFNHAIDISYFMFCIPFVYLYIFDK